jgi:prevent-host-death family protein
MAVWQLQEAKQRFSELIKSVEAEGPQIVTRHGHEVAVVITMAEYRHLRNDKEEEDFKAFLQSAPGVGLEISRPAEFPRPVILDEEEE